MLANRLYFHTLTNVFARNPFLLILIQTPGVYRATRASSQTLAHSFTLFAKSETYLLSLQWVPHSFQKQPGCTPILPNLGIAPSFLCCFLLRYTRVVASRSLFPWTSASPRRTPPSQI